MLFPTREFFLSKRDTCQWHFSRVEDINCVRIHLTPFGMSEQKIITGFKKPCRMTCTWQQISIKIWWECDIWDQTNNCLDLISNMSLLWSFLMFSNPDSNGLASAYLINGIWITLLRKTKTTNRNKLSLWRKIIDEIKSYQFLGNWFDTSFYMHTISVFSLISWSYVLSNHLKMMVYVPYGLSVLEKYERCSPI